MSRFIRTLKDSFKVLAGEPKLFLPKILIAFLYSIPMIALPHITVEAVILRQASIELLLLSFFWLLFLFFVMLVDVVINAMYPLMIHDFYQKKPVSFTRAFKSSLKKFFVVIPAVLVVEAIAFAVIVLLSIPISLALLMQNYILAGAISLVFLAIMFVLFVLFYLIYPVTTLEKGNFISSLDRSISVAMKNKKDVSKATVVTFFISLVAIVLAFLIELTQKPEFLLPVLLLWAGFIVLRIISAMFYTYQYVLNPVFYLEYEKGVFLEGAV